MSENPKVSIITGYYNREDYVDDSIQSLLDQTFTDFELIIFDDNSPDNTYAKLKHYADKDSRIKLIKHPTNIGFTNGMVNGILTARGEYIAVHGSGDISLKNRIEVQAAYLDSHPDVVIVGSHYQNVDPHSNVQRLVANKEFHTLEEIEVSNPLSHGEVMYRKDVYMKAGGYRRFFKFSQDKDLWVRMLKYGRIAVPQQVLYHRIVNFDSASYTPVKLIAQKKFSLLANSINKLSAEEQKKIEETVLEKGVDAVVDSYDAKIQKGKFDMYNVLLVKNKLSGEKLFIQNSKGGKRFYYITTAWLNKWLFLGKALNMAYRVQMNLKK